MPEPTPESKHPWSPVGDPAQSLTEQALHLDKAARDHITCTEEREAGAGKEPRAQARGKMVSVGGENSNHRVIKKDAGL